MSWPSLKTYDRVNLANGAEERARGFEQSYFGMRLVIGVVGVLLPLLLVFVDGVLLKQPISFRGSMSAYYHSGAHDLFVGGLAVSGVMLATYMFWNWWTWDFLLSLVAGLAVLGVATFPTSRPRPVGAASGCEFTANGTPPCTALQEFFREETTRTIHGSMAAVVVVTFGALCVVFALRDFGYGKAAHELVKNQAGDLGPAKIWRALPSPGRPARGVLSHVFNGAPRTVLYVLCLVGVMTGGAWAVLGPDWVLPHTYSGELIAFASFGAAWIVASWDLLKESSVFKAVASVGKGRSGAVTPPADAA